MANLLISSMSEEMRITLRSIGAGALNQATKAIILARRDMAARGFDLYIIPGFATVKGNDDKEITAIVQHCYLK